MKYCVVGRKEPSAVGIIYRFSGPNAPNMRSVREDFDFFQPGIDISKYHFFKNHKSCHSIISASHLHSKSCKHPPWNYHPTWKATAFGKRT
jgi:hypothetical protein